MLHLVLIFIVMLCVDRLCVVMLNAVILYVVAPYDAESMASFPFMNSAVHGQTSASKTKRGPSFSTLGGSVRVRLAKIVQ